MCCYHFLSCIFWVIFHYLYKILAFKPNILTFCEKWLLRRTIKMIKKILSRNIKTKIHIPFHIIKDTIPHGLKNKNICTCPMFCASPKQDQDTNPIICTMIIRNQGKISLHILLNDPCQVKVMPSLPYSTSSNPPNKSPILSNNFHKNKYTQASSVSIN